jgi:hypothetical protein
MTMCRGDAMKTLQKAWKWVTGQVVGDVPAGDALCEFDCRNRECTQGDWENCDRRRQRGAGEFMPANTATPEPAVIADPKQPPPKPS